MDLTNLVKLVTDYGVSIVCAVILIYLFVKMHQKTESRLDKLLENQITHPNAEQIKSVDAINEKIYQESTNLLQALGADRVYIFLYHNGGVSTSGLSFQKMSCVCEVVGQGILPLINERQNLHRTSYVRVCERLAREGFVAAPNTDYLKQLDSFLYNESLERRSYSSYFDALRDVSGMVVGALCVDFCSPHPDKSEEFIKQKVIQAGLRISALVDVKDEVKN